MTPNSIEFKNIYQIRLLLTLIFWFVIGPDVLSQLNIPNPLVQGSDTTNWITFHTERLKYFDISPIESIHADYVVRLWTPAVMIEASHNKNEYSCRVYTYVQEVWRGEVTERRFVGLENFGPEVGEKIIRFIKEKNIEEIPSDKYIKGWRQGFDGITYIVEILSNEGYSFKHYWSPIPDLPQAVRIIEFRDYVLRLLGENSQSLDNDKIPFPGYHYYGSSYDVIRPLSVEEFRSANKRRKREIRAANDSSLFNHVDSLIHYQIGYQYERKNRYLPLNNSTKIPTSGFKTYSIEEPPLIVVDGEILRMHELLNYQLRQIKQIDVIGKNDNGMKAIYGTSAKNGVLIIQTKKFYRKKKKGR